jgi:hypothetical protein
MQPRSKKSMLPARVLATSDRWTYWLIGDQVYRASASSVLDIYGHPADRRWECPIWHWNHYRANWSFAQDVPIIATKKGSNQ